MRHLLNLLCRAGWHTHANFRPDPDLLDTWRFDCHQSDYCRGRIHRLHYAPEENTL